MSFKLFRRRRIFFSLLLLLLLVFFIIFLSRLIIYLFVIMCLTAWAQWQRSRHQSTNFFNLMLFNYVCFVFVVCAKWLSREVLFDKKWPHFNEWTEIETDFFFFLFHLLLLLLFVALLRFSVSSAATMAATSYCSFETCHVCCGCLFFFSPFVFGFGWAFF